ncbi:hypothetical protein EOPP23_12030 [Endozoicomonas sp. OPT23]|uniref:pilus assembly protein n=1 Tax=Endozoicomonas sp. OPT23 TaxID=2072845 RepID=UPI00129AAA13|nr:PilC/PilY family type IV pilus protein [Endozoicomonas sp. OPT23]MRI33715.1 hypothetical protein [Endozoicomonas sp. OPT23]
MNDWKWLSTSLTSLIFIAGQAFSAPSSQLYSAVPPLLNKSTEPLVMLVMSVDHELFKKAYPDYSDLDGDGVLDTTYKDNFDYLGYFETNWCYQYSSSLGRFTPVQQSTGENDHYCESSNAPWSGNFLNWGSMSRIDVLRRVLFGGKRSTDSSSKTVLERAYLARDIHAFVKVYQGSDINKLTPYSSAASLCNLATSENGAPIMRVASGSWNRWASTEVKQCQWGASNSPGLPLKLAEMTVRVESCVTNKDAESSSRCRQYPDQNNKPVGLLQNYGEDGRIRFGLISGSYDKNISGGVLRKNISKIAGNSLGQDDEVVLSSGIFNSSVKGIINQINTFRLAKYSYNQNKYTDCSSYGISVSTFKSSRSTYSDRHCSNWGNPLAEMYLEALRYFAGQSSPTSTFNTSSDTSFVSGLSTESWVSPLTAANACANCSIILLSSGLNSFDADELGNSSGIPGLEQSGSINSKTDEVGELEYNNQFSGQYLVGGTGSTRQCTAKHLNGLSEARGLCPELPQLEGSYQLAGLSWHANKTDLITRLDGKQKVKTYAIQLAESMPSFTLDADGNQLTFQPVCHTSNNFGSGTNFSGSGSDCTLTDVVIENMVLNDHGHVLEGQLLFTWEDSLWGNDYDYDASSRISFCVGNQCEVTSSDLRIASLAEDQIRIGVQVDGVFAGLNLRFSYTVTGSNDDGLKSDFVYKGQSHYEVNTFTANGNAAGVLKKPLWFAAKYGGFVDLDGDGTPKYSINGQLQQGDDREWDSRNNETGAIGSDGLPDNYYFAKNPAMLEVQLGQVFRDIASRISSATNAALFSNSQSGTGVLYQALFQPSLELNGRKVTWGGILHALFVDDKGLLREDSNGDAALGDYDTDKIVELIFDPNSSQTQLQRYSTTDEGLNRTPEGSLQPLNQLKPIWDARERLSDVPDVVTQRNYSTSASAGRHIFTWLDDNDNGQVDTAETQTFTPATFTGSEGYLGVSSTDVEPLVNYVRGVESDGSRSRTIDFDGDGQLDTWRLGDIVHSTPHLVSKPSSRFDVLHQDSSYTAFLQKYQNRRHVLYVGANDGLIHAFNGGFWNESNHSYTTSGENNEIAHPLGTELWAYAPMNLLPHLQWLKEEDYPHVYYMDGEPATFDVNIFSADADHPGGWGTILVIGMRLGGGSIDVTVNSQTRTMRSAYVVLDVTNPEKAPKLLAEITHSQLGFTTSRPALVKRRVPAVENGQVSWSSTPDSNDWYLVFGSGPVGSGEPGIRTALDTGFSDQTMKLFVYDLNSRDFVTDAAPMDSQISLAYAGDMTSTDWNSDYIDDAVYFGAVETGGSNLSGKLLRLNIGFNSSGIQLPNVQSTLLDTGRPVTAAPLILKDNDDRWLYVGTGRLLTYADNRTNQVQYFYGMKESSALDVQLGTGGGLIDTSLVNVYSNGSINKRNSISTEAFTIDGSAVQDFDSLKSVMRTKPGWKIALSGNGSVPSGRNITSASRLFSSILFTEYQPPSDSCRVDGNSYLTAVHFQTGTALPTGLLGYQDLGEDVDHDLAVRAVGLGLGYASAPVIHHGKGNNRTAVTQGAGGSISSQFLNYQFQSSGRMSWRQIFGIPWLGN